MEKRIIVLAVLVLTVIGYLHLHDAYIPELPLWATLFSKITRIVAWSVWVLATIFAVMFVLGLLYDPKDGRKKKDVNMIIVTLGREEMKRVIDKNIEALKSFGFRPTVLINNGPPLENYHIVKTPSSDLQGKSREG